MNNISNFDGFKKTLASLSLAQQRQVGARFAMNVLDITDGSCNASAKMVAENSAATPEELESAYHTVHTYYSRTHLLCSAEMDYSKQGAHFVAKACMACMKPAFDDTPPDHLADVVAGYCRLARACSAIPDEDDQPSLANADGAFRNEIEAQHRILNEFLAEHPQA